MISPTGGLACWQAISGVQALARQAMGAFVGVLMRRDMPSPGCKRGRLRLPERAPLPSSPVCHSWRLEVGGGARLP
jgi:hypothetical protein